MQYDLLDTGTATKLVSGDCICILKRKLQCQLRSVPTIWQETLLSRSAPEYKPRLLYISHFKFSSLMLGRDANLLRFRHDAHDPV